MSRAGVIKMVDAGADHPLLLDRGVHEFTFYYQLPPDLPSTYSGIYGSVSYVAKVRGGVTLATM